MRRLSGNIFIPLISLLLVFSLLGCQSVDRSAPADIPPAAESTLPEEPAEPAAAEESVQEEPVTSLYPYAGYDLSIDAYDGYAVIAYPAEAAKADVESFLAYEAGRYNTDGVYYSFSDDGTLILTYPEGISREERKSLSDAFVADAVSYIGGDVSAVEEKEIPVSSSYTYAGYDLSIDAYDGYAVITYPAEATDDDVAGFLAAEAEKYDIAGVYYTLEGDGTLVLTYPEGISREERKALSDAFFDDAVAYVTYVPEPAAEPAEAVPAEEPAETAAAEEKVQEEPVSSQYSYAGYDLSIDAYDGYAVITYPAEATDDDVAGFLAAEAEKYSVSGVYYTLEGDGTLVLTYPEGISREERKALSDAFFDDAVAYVTYVPEPAAETAEAVPAEESAETPAAEAVPAEETLVPESATAEETAYPFGVEPVVKASGDDDGFELYIIHTNDVHGRIETGTDGSMGYTKLSSLVSMARSLTPDVLVLDGGDTLHGTNLANMFEGQTVLDIMNMIGYDAMTPGNHDFNYGAERLEEAAAWAEDNASFRIINANITDEETGDFIFQPYSIFDYNGFKVCVIGLTSPDTKTKSHPKNTVGLDFMSDAVVSNAQAAVDMAHELADFVVVLGHIGVTPDGESGITSPLICQSIDGIDLFVDAHSHTVMDGGEVVNGTLIVSAGSYLNYAGVVRVDVAADGSWKIGDAFLLPATEVLDPSTGDILSSYGVSEVPDDPAIDSYVEEKNGELGEIFGEVVANIPMDLNGERSDVRTRTTNLSALICDAMTAESGADFSIMNGGGIRASLSAGPVTLGDINNVLPFTNTITVCQISPADVYAALEHGYSLLPKENGAFSQTDLKVVYSASAPAGERIKRVYLGDELLDRNDTETVYTVATNDFMAAGGDGYTMFGRVLTEGSMLNEVFIDYLSSLYPVE